MSTTEEHSIPLIDLSPLWKDPNGVKIIANEFAQKFKDVGFAYIINHQVPDKLLDDMFQAAIDFHNLPLNVKMKIVQNSGFRGYLPSQASQLNVSTQGASRKPNVFEAFIMMNEVAEDHPDFKTVSYCAGPNQWPQEMPNLKTTMHAYRDVMTALASKLVEVFSVSCGLDAHALGSFFENPTYFLRLHRYSGGCAEDDEFGIAPHTDVSFLTILAQDSIGGLEVKHPKKGWISVPHIPGALILNAGDLMHRWSNGTYQSSIHRVLQSQQDRYSIPFFFDPNVHAMIEVLPTCVDEQRSPQFPPIMYTDYAIERFKPNYKYLNNKK